MESDYTSTIEGGAGTPAETVESMETDGVVAPNAPSLVSSETEEDEESISEGNASPFIPSYLRDDAPLSGILRPEYQDVDPRQYFPDYKRNGILRFSKMFGVNPKALSQNMIWWPSKTFCKRPEQRKLEGPESNNEFGLNIGPSVTKDKCVCDQTDLLLKSEAELEAMRSHPDDEDDEPPPWRYGPAQMWYDRLGLPEKPRRFDYGGLKTNRFNIISSMSKRPITAHPLTKEELLPVNLLHWEDEIIIDSSEVDYQKAMYGREPKSGWISTQQIRTYQSYRSVFSHDDVVQGPDQTHSIFPADFEWENVRWEDDVIFDPDDMPSIPEPRVLTVEYEDDPAAFGMPEDISFEERSKEDGPRGAADRKDHQFTKKSKMILSQIQRRQKQEEEEHMETRTAQNADKDVFNMSNDEYYAPKSTHRAIGSGSAIQHSIPAQNIHRAFFPTYLDTYHLRHLHRQPPSRRVMRHFIDREVIICNALDAISDAENQRKRQTLMDSGTEIFHMRSVRDLSAKDGTLVCVEYSEEHPPLLSQPGMASKIRNYYRRKSQKENDPQFEFGETAFTMNPPFPGNLNIGQTVQALENNMYRAPIFKHKAPTVDFILIRSADGLFLRECPNMFVAGQECPLYEVPTPSSKKAAAFDRDFLMAYIYRLFWASEHQPRRLRIDDIKDAFPDYGEPIIRKRLKQCAEFTRSTTGPDSNYWMIKEDFRLPSKEEVLGMLTPEMCCAHYSMQAAEQRLKDAGYGEKYFLVPEKDEDSDDEVTIEDEIKCAPWNTTRAYISATKGKCLLDQTGIADPTGCGQGFSYVRVAQKPQKDEMPQMPKRLVTGTNADLRKLPLKEAKEMCRAYGVKEDEINTLTRWEIIDVIRTLSTQAAKDKADFSGMGRFARGNIKVASADAQDKYKNYCQNVFDLQNKILASSEQLSTDEGTDNEDSDDEEMASRVEKMLDSSNKSKTTKAAPRKEVEAEDEEKDRLALQRMIHGDAAADKPDTKKIDTRKDAPSKQQLPSAPASNVIRKLRIHRVFTNPDGSQSSRVEIINNQQVIDSYDHIRRTRDGEFIKVFASMDDQYKEEMRKKKRRIQDQLRRIKRKEQKGSSGTGNIGRPKKPESEKKPPPPPKASLLKMKCSACGQTGHMKTNKNCPLYGQRVAKKKEKTVGDICKGSMSNISLEEMSLSTGELMTLEGTKFKISQKFFQHVESQKKKDLKLRIPTEFINQQKVTSSADEKTPRLPNSKPEVESDADDSLLSSSGAYRHEVCSPASTAGSSTARTPLTGRSYSRRRETIDEADYFGPIKSVHRRRADPRISFATILHDIFNELKNMPGSAQFMHPVTAREAPDYHSIIKTPMDLLQIRTHITANKYELRTQFMVDLALIVENSKLYNGEAHPITASATRLLERGCMRIKENEVRLIELEKAINPLLDENDIVGFSHILRDIVQNCKNLPRSAAFHAKVDPRKHPNYYDRIKTPMDLGTIEQKVKDQQYQTIELFLADMEQIYKNSQIYNGELSAYTAKAKEIYEHAVKLVNEKKTELHELQSRIGAPAATLDAQSVDYNTMEEDNDEMIGDINFGLLDYSEAQQEDYQESRQEDYQEIHPEDYQVIQQEDYQESRQEDYQESRQEDYQEIHSEDYQEIHPDAGEEIFETIMPTDDEATQDAWDSATASGLAGSSMQMTGQLNADLELTDSDDSDNDDPDNKRPRLDIDLDEL